MKLHAFAFLFIASACIAQQQAPDLKATPGSVATPDPHTVPALSAELYAPRSISRQQIIQKKEILYRVMDSSAPAGPDVQASPDPSPTPLPSIIPIVSPSPQGSPTYAKTPDLQIANVVIGKGGDRDLHAQLAWPTRPAKLPMPGIIYIHGGGWKGGDYKLNLAETFTPKGYFTVSAEYRLSPEAKWPAQIEDCKLAIRWLRANAKKYNVDPNRIGVWGISAGGHLVAFLGATENQPKFEGRGGYPGVSSKVQAVVDFSGPTDFRDGTFTAGVDNIPEQDRLAIMKLAELLFGKPFAGNPELYAQGSPITYVHKDMPPFLVVHGEKDPIVSYQQSKTFVDAMQKAGAPVEFISVANGGHRLHSVVPGQPSAPNPGAIYKSMEEFFDKHLKQ
ncbi:MAG: alpha/beta hydrolase [Chthoniobacterales bacterium]